MDIGYARVSTQDQHPALQLDALHAAGCVKVFVEQASGAQRERPQLQAALDYARPGDTLVVWKLDRLARSLTQLIETIEGLAARDIGFRSLTEAIEMATAGDGWCSTSLRAWPSSSEPSSASAPGLDSTRAARGAARRP
jgi:DNA invertase Pin-like site-specific DNA recombinase